MNSTIASTFQALFLQFSSVFTVPSFANFVTLATGWILCAGRHTLTRVIQHGSGPARKKHHSTLYRFLSRAAWAMDEVGRVLVHLGLPLIPGAVVYALTDDTLCRHSGPHLWGAAMHHDPLVSTYGRGTSAGRKAFFAFGHSWVIVSLWVPLPWNPQRGLALPVLFRLYRSKKRCPETFYHKRTDLAAEMVELLAAWIPPDRQLVVVGDSEYACRTLVGRLPEGATLLGPMPMNAAVFDLPPRKKGMGRPRRKGKRLPSPLKWAKSGSARWKRRKVFIYGREVEVLTKTRVALWYRVADTKPVRIILTRDPRGRIQDRAYFSTDPELSVEEILEGYCRRWPQEVLHRDVKQFLGLQDPQNGWWRRPHGRRARRKIAGPQPHPRRGEAAVRRTVPLAFLSYALTVIWYFKHGSVAKEIRKAQQAAPWYRHKREPCFADMLKAARRELWTARLSAHPALRPVRSKVSRVLPEWLLAA